MSLLKRAGNSAIVSDHQSIKDNERTKNPLLHSAHRQGREHDAGGGGGRKLVRGGGEWTGWVSSPGYLLSSVCHCPLDLDSVL